MENLKKFIASPKRNTIVGLVSSILMLLQAIFIIVISKEIEFKEISHIIKNFVSLGFILYFSIILYRMNRRRGNLKIATNILIVSLILTILLLILFQFTGTLGFILYFSIILYRMNRRRGNLKIATNILIVSLILTILLLILFQFTGTMDSNNIIAIIVNIIILIFLFNILKRKSTKFSNNIFLVMMVVYTIYQLVMDNMNIIIFTNEFDTRNFLIWICNVSYLGIVPYFYNYYEILKGEKIKNG